MAQSDSPRPRGRSGRQIYESSLAGAQERPFIPRLRSDGPPPEPRYHSLTEFREAEGRAERKRALRALWEQLPELRANTFADPDVVADGLPIRNHDALTLEKAEKLKGVYDEELLQNCGVGSESSSTRIPWKDFKKYAEKKEAELWSIFHDELDLDGNGQLDAQELSLALSKAGIQLSPSMMRDFTATLSDYPSSDHVSFRDFRNSLLLLPRKINAEEIYRYYEVQKFLGDDGRGAARVNMEGDVSLSAEDRPPEQPVRAKVIHCDIAPSDRDHEDHHDHKEEVDEEEEGHQDWFANHTAVKFLAAGGVAGAVSRTCTAPFDRLKIFLITRPPEMGGPTLTPKPSVQGVKTIASAIARIYAEGGVLAFWTGNGLSVAKIFPESAIKFMTYESSKRAFAKYWDHVEDSRDISQSSRFMSGGIGGITSQLSIYPIETLKTQMMSSTGDKKRSFVSSMRHLWQLGGIRAYYRGLTIGLVGVFPYSAIDMSTFEALKLAYVRSTGIDEPGVLALLACGSVSGSVGATSVYPLNLVRTRLQAAGSSGHPQRYAGVLDVVRQTYARDGWRGFYRGLVPTLAKVVPSVSISYVVYENTKRRLGV